MSIEDEFTVWERNLPAEITSDPLWTCTAYRLATFAAVGFWDDISRLASDPRTVDMANQLQRAVGSIGATYAEAYSRRSPKDRCRYYEYSIGSAREARDWTLKARRVIGDERCAEQIRLLTRIIQLLSVTIVRERPRERDGKNKAPRRVTDEQ